jgi:hypothetical protein
VSKPFTDIDGQALEALIARVSEAKENNLALSPEDCQLLLDALVTLASMQERLSNHDVTVHKLRKLLGIEKSSEGLGQVLKKPGAKKSTRSRRKVSEEDAFTPVKPQVVIHPVDNVAKGDVCGECLVGKVYKTEPGNFLRISGQSPFVPEQHVMSRFRCNACGVYTTAPLPENVVADGDAGQKYGYSARALMAIYKYFAGLPFYRQCSIQKLLGVKISASSVFDQVEFVCNDVHPVFLAMLQQAANARHYSLDDTTHRILDAKPIEKQVRGSDKTQMRSGVYTSGVIATTADNHSIVLFETNIGHAGEFIDSILQQRAAELAKPILMSDALASNRPSQCAATLSLCNSHARRQFADVVSHFPEEVAHILTRYQAIWTADDESHALNHTPSARLAYHQQHSQPVMDEIKDWGQQRLDSGDVEANSSLGKAISYFIKHFNGLTKFCTTEGAKIDNNQLEAMLKIVVRDRKNAMFHKTLHGAVIGDVVTSLIATASEAGINVFEYFTILQRERILVRKDPGKYLPWRYQARD